MVDRDNGIRLTSPEEMARVKPAFNQVIQPHEKGGRGFPTCEWVATELRDGWVGGWLQGKKSLLY